MKNISHHAKGHRFGLILPQKRSDRYCPKLSKIRTEMHIMEGRQSRKCFYCRTEGHTRNYCPNNHALR